MNLTPEEKFNQEVWWILQQLKYLEVSGRKKEIITLVIKARPSRPSDEPSPSAQESALLKLEEWKAIKIKDSEEQEVTYGRDFIYTLEILQQKFNEIYEKFRKLTEKYQLKYSQVKEIFTNEVIPDHTAETERQMDEARKWGAERWEREKLHKEQLKQDRILRTPVDKYTHALDLIIERAEYAEDGNSFSIEFYDFNFEQMIGSKMLEKFLTEMQKDGCFEKYARTNYAGGTRFGFIKPSVKKLKAFKEKRGKQETKTDRFSEEVLKTEQLLDKLESDINEKARIIESPAKYENGILKFMGKEINFRNKPNQKDLLATVFEEPKKNWSYDEIQNKWDEMIKLEVIDRPKDYWKKFYSAGDDINKAVAIEAQVKDFVIKNTKEIRINPKYI